MSPLFYKICLVLLVLSLRMANVELSFSVALLLSILCFRKQISSQLVLVAFYLITLILIGSLTVFSPENGYYYFLKDLIYYLRPILVMTAAYFIVMRLDNKFSFLNIIVLIGFYYAIIHLLRMATVILDFPNDITTIRNSFGRYNHIETIAFFLIITVKNLPIKKTRFKIVYQILVACLAISFLFYFSRTMMLVVILMTFAYYGYLKLNQRGVIALSGLLIIVSSFLGFLNFYEPEEENAGLVDTFLFKVKNSITESFSVDDINIAYLDRRELWKHWRAYEAQVVYNEINKEKQWFTGEGFGSTIDIGFEARLAGEYSQHLSLTHNGLAYLYLKTGIIGLMIYFIMILYLYSFSYSNKKTPLHSLGNNLLIACAFYIIISSFVVTGIFKPYDMATLIMGGAFAFKQLDTIENRNTRNEGDT